MRGDVILVCVLCEFWRTYLQQLAVGETYNQHECQIEHVVNQENSVHADLRRQIKAETDR